jgi:protease IV
MKRSSMAWGALGLGCFLVLAFGAGLVLLVGFGSSDLATAPFALGGRVGIVDVEGVILSADRVRETLERFRKTPNVKAVVVRINSPGGGVAASQELNREIARFRRETGRPVVASMESVAASGGYYTAVAADRIVANAGTITGSIGVIIQWVNYGDLLEWAKLRPVTMTSGALKDAGNPMRPMREDEKAYFQALIERIRGQFRSAVAEGRKGKLKPGTLETMSDGRVVTGDEAVELGLVDQLGDYRDAVDLAARMGGLKTPAETWHPRPPRPGLLTILFGGGSDDSSRSSLAERLISGAPVGGGWNVYFLW